MRLLPGTPQLWRGHDFRTIWIAQTISQIGSRITRDGLPIAAVLVLGATPSQTGLLATFGAAPAVLLGLFAGVVVDRVRRLPMMVAMDVARAVLLATIPIAAMFGVLSYALLCAVAFAAAACTLLFDVADRSLLPGVVEPADLLDANGALGVSSSLAEISGPPLTGLLVQVLTAPIAIVVDALSYVASALLLVRVRAAPVLPPRNADSGTWRDIGDGLRFVRTESILKALLAATGIFSLFGSFFGALYWIFTLRTLGLPTAVMGVLVAFGGVGGLLGAASAGRIAKRFGTGPSMIGALFCAGVANMLLVPAPPHTVLAIVLVAGAQLAGDFMFGIFFVNQITLQQALTPDHLRGRTAALGTVVDGSLRLVGLAAGGFLAEIFGVRPVIGVAAAGIAAAALVLLGTRLRTLRAAGPIEPRRAVDAPPPV